VPFDWHGNEAGGTKGIDLLLNWIGFSLYGCSVLLLGTGDRYNQMADGFPISWSDGNLPL